MPDVNEPEQLQDIHSLTFEEAFRRLGEMATSLEDGGLTVAEATSLYAQGMSLVRRCNQLLNEAELTITNLHDAYAIPEAGRHSPENDFIILPRKDRQARSAEVSEFEFEPPDPLDP